MNYFAYGSNMDQKDLEEWCERQKKEVPVLQFVCASCLEDHKLVFNYSSSSRQGGAANIIKSSGNCVYGILFQISKNDLITIRKKEGYPNYYDEIYMTVKSIEKQLYIYAITYKVVKHREKDVPQRPTKYYMDLILNNARKYNFPRDYIYYLESIETQ
jgi:hypothetical protein